MRRTWIGIAALALLVGCKEEGTSRAPAGATEAALVERTLGPGLAPDIEVARVGDAVVTVGDVATWLSFFPTLTVRQAVDDLVDLEALLRAADGIDWPARGLDQQSGHMQGLAVAWLRGMAQRPEVTAEPTPAEIDAVIADPNLLVDHRRPALVRVSHVLVPLRADDTARDAELLPILQSEVRRLRLLERARVDDLETTRTALLAAIPNPPAIRVERHFSFPREWSGPVRWKGVELVVPAFADFAFGLQPGQIGEPLRTDFGWHIVLAEERLPAWSRSNDELRVHAAQHLRTERLRKAVEERAAELARRYPVQINQDNLAILSRSVEERIEGEAKERARQYGQGD